MKVQSTSTPGHKMLIRSWLAELVMLRKYGKLPPNFWRRPEFKSEYTSQVIAISKHIKKYGEMSLLSISENTTIHDFTDYAHIEYLLQKYKAIFDLIKLPKDKSSVKNMTEDVEDIREVKPKKSLKSNFARLDGLGT